MNLPTEFPPSKPHPTLLLNDGQLADLRTRIATDPLSRRLFEKLRESADATLGEKPVEHVVTGRRLLAVSRQCLGRMLTLGVVGRVTGEAKYLDRAVQEVAAAAGFSDWNPSHFLDTAEMTMAVALGYDWLHDHLDDAAKARLADAIVTKGLEPSFLPQFSNHWVKAEHNWNQVCHAGLVAGALAIRQDHPDLALKVVRRAVENVPHAGSACAPDGVYPEGPMYWSYGTTFEVLLIDLLEGAFGTDFGLAAAPGFMESAVFYQQMATPTGRDFNFSDCNLSRDIAPATFWFARRANDVSLAAWEIDRLRDDGAGFAKENNRFAALALLWWDPKLAAGKAKRSTRWHGRGPTSIAVLRSDWNDRQAVFAGFKGGSPSVNHAHMDVGSFVLEADGIRWALDLDKQDYHSLESAGINMWERTQDGERWQVFRIGPEAHNILRFGGKPQLVNGRGDLVSFSDSPKFAHAILELKDLYDSEVSGFRRGVALLPDRRVVVQDEWTPGASEAAWQMLTNASVAIDADGRSAVLEQEGRRLRLEVAEPPAARMTVEDVAALMKPHDAPNPNTRRIVVKCPGAGGLLRVILTPGSARPVAPAPNIPLAGWKNVPQS